MAVKLNSTGGGSVTLDTPSTASNYTVTLPAANTTLADTSSTQTLTNKTIASLATTGTATFGGIIDTGSTGQIQFPATQNPSSNANILDDYEEGTFTTTISSESNCSGTSMAVGSSWYVKVGGLVSYAFRVTTTISSANTKLAFAYTLPFAQSSISDTQGGSALVEGPSPYPYAAGNVVDASSGSHLAYLAVGAAALNFSGSANIYVTGQFKAS